MSIPNSSPGTLFTNCRLWTPGGIISGCFGVSGNKFDYEGTKAPHSGYGKKIDLGGKLVLPAFTDGHVHLVNGSLMMTRINCTGIKTPQELRSKVLQYIHDNPAAEWIVGGNLHIKQVFKDFTPGTSSMRLFLDAISENKPLYIANYDYHSAVCSTAAMEISGLNKKITDYTDEEAERDFEGKPTGFVIEKARDFVFYSIPSPAFNTVFNSVDKMIGILHSYGITTISDITYLKHLEIYKKLFEQKKLNIRINSYIPLTEFENLEKCEKQMSDVPKDIFEIKGFKEYFDGALGSETGLYKMNYLGRNSNGYKTEIAGSGKLIELSKMADKAGKQLIIHAIGDLAVSGVLDIAEVLIKENGSRDRRFRIEHAQHIDEADFERFVQTGAIISAQPLHMKYDIKIVQEKLPAEIVKRTHNYKALLDRGITVAFGTDFPIVEINPFENIKLAVTRKSGDEIFLPEYKFNMHECITSYTINNAYASFNENKAGTIEMGKLADFIVMKDDLFNMDEDEINEAKIEATYFNGEEVYRG